MIVFFTYTVGFLWLLLLKEKFISAIHNCTLFENHNYIKMCFPNGSLHPYGQVLLCEDYWFIWLRGKKGYPCPNKVVCRYIFSQSVQNNVII